jgi:adenylate cyclase class 2
MKYHEYEAKFYPINKDKYRKSLKAIGALLITPERKMRRSIVDNHSFPSLKADYVRVRDEGDKVRLSVKTHAREGGNLSDQQEIDVEVNDYDKTIKILESLGIKLDRYQETLRETWSYEGAEITIDTWPGLEPYSEIEASSEEKVKEIATKLQFDWDKKIITSCIEIYMKKYNLSVEETLKRSSYITFENNPFK